MERGAHTTARWISKIFRVYGVYIPVHLRPRSICSRVHAEVKPLREIRTFSTLRANCAVHPYNRSHSPSLSSRAHQFRFVSVLF